MEVKIGKYFADLLYFIKNIINYTLNEIRPPRWHCCLFVILSMIYYFYIFICIIADFV